MRTTQRTLFFVGLGALVLTCFSFQQGSFDLKESIARGEQLYTGYCISCHLDQGQGIENVYPPLAKSDYLMANRRRSIQQVLYGASGEMKVNGQVYNMDMTGFDLSDTETADVMNYIRNSWGNKGSVITPVEVKAARKKS